MNGRCGIAALKRLLTDFFKSVNIGSASRNCKSIGLFRKEIIILSANADCESVFRDAQRKEANDEKQNHCSFGSMFSLDAVCINGHGVK